MTQLASNRLVPSEVLRNQWQAKPEHGTPHEALLERGYWAHVSVKLRRGDIITALAEDNSYFMEMLVLDAGKLFASVCQIRLIEITAAQMFNVKIPEGFEIKFRGPRKWSVLRGKDVLAEDMEKAAAETWLMDHLKVIETKKVA